MAALKELLGEQVMKQSETVDVSSLTGNGKYVGKNIIFIINIQSWPN